MKYYLPYYYIRLSRLRTLRLFVSWLIIAALPPWIVVAWTTSASIPNVTLLFVVAFTLFYYAYETGYIENDVKTVDRESSPTLRLDDSAMNDLRVHFWRVVAIRHVLLAIGVGAFVTLGPFLAPDLSAGRFVAGLLLILVVFALHNRIRNRMNIVTFFLMTSLKYTVPVLPFVPVERIPEIVLLLLAAFPVVRTIEHASRKRYGLGLNEWPLRNRHVFRAAYYLFVLVVFFLATRGEEISHDNLYSAFLIIYVGFAIYRAAIAMASIGLVMGASGGSHHGR